MAKKEKEIKENSALDEESGGIDAESLQKMNRQDVLTSPLEDLENKICQEELIALEKARTDLTLALEPSRNQLNNVKRKHNLICGEFEDTIEENQKNIKEQKAELKIVKKNFRERNRYLTRTHEFSEAVRKEKLDAVTKEYYANSKVCNDSIFNSKNEIKNAKVLLKGANKNREKAIKEATAIFDAEQAKVKAQYQPAVNLATTRLKQARAAAKPQIKQYVKDAKNEYLRQKNALNPRDLEYKKQVQALKHEYKSKVSNTQLISRKRYFINGLGNFCLKVLKALGTFLLAILMAIANIFIYAFKGVVGLGLFLYRFFKKCFEHFLEDDTAGRWSHIAMGASSFANHQILNGILYALTEVGFILFMALAGLQNLWNLGTLGAVEFDPAHPEIHGDNSFLCLLYGLFTILIIIAFIYFYTRNLNAANTNTKIKYGYEFGQSLEKLIAFAKDRSEILDVITKRVSTKVMKDGSAVEKRHYFRRHHIRKALIALGWNRLDAIYVSRLDWKRYDTDHDGLVSDTIFDVNKFHHTFDRYNEYQRITERFEVLLKAFKNYKEVIDCVYARDSRSKQNGVEEIMEGTKVNPKEAISRILLYFNTTSSIAKQIYNYHFEQLDEEAIKVQGEEMKLRYEAYVAEHPNGYAGHALQFNESIGLLLNDKFHITVLIPPFLFAGILVILPLVFTIIIAFTDFNGFHTYPKLFSWVGLDNFAAILTGQSSMTSSEHLPYTIYTLLGWTIIWAICATFINYILGMILALLINKKGIKLKKMWRTIFVITIAIPQFVSLLAMSKIFSETGPINGWLISIGAVTADNPIPFLTDGTLAKIMVIVINVWVGIPYTMLITSGILMNIPEDLYESARVDGAGPGTQFFKITLPYMLFVTGPYLLTQFIGNINNFNVIYFATGGGPTNDTNLYKAGQTDLLITWLYKLTTGNDSLYNLASALGIIIFVICAFFSLIMYGKLGSVQNEEEFQ